MSFQQENSKHIAKNTLLLYIRMVFTMGVGLFTSRIILDTLGIEDYGIYNVVGGVVSMFSFLSTSLATAISRFLTYSLGKKDIEQLKNIFSTSIFIQFVLALIVALLAEIVGVWFMNTHMSIPADRIGAANWIIHCSILTFVINIVSVPYNATIIAHERMSAFAYISILEVSLKLLVAYSLYISAFDKLKTYGVLLVMVAIIIRFAYSWYCHRNFEECKLRMVFDRSLFKQMTGFAGWNVMGTGVYLLNTQGVNIVTNIFFGVTVNAARGIADQVKGIVMQFVSNFTTAINPQITKSYAANDNEYLFKLICKGAKLSYFMILMLAMPLMFETETILKLWLKDYPPYAPLFLRLVLIEQMVDFLGNTTARAVWATGKIRKYYIYVSSISMLVLPVSYCFYWLGFPPESSYCAFIAIYILLIPIRLQVLKELIPTFHPFMFYKEVMLPALTVSLISLMLPFTFYCIMDNSLLKSIIIIVVCLLSVAVTTLGLGLSKTEREYVFAQISRCWKS